MLHDQINIIDNGQYLNTYYENKAHDDIYSELMLYSGPHTRIDNISKNLTGHDIYGSYHFEKFNKTDALRNTLLRFEEFQIPQSLEGKTIFDIGSCLGSLSFECARRNSYSVKGFEYCNERVNVCTKLATYLNLDNIYFYQADVDILSKNVTEFINNYGIADIVFCCALDAYVNIDRLYKMIADITIETCYFETNSNITDDEFMEKMMQNGFNSITILGMSKSDAGYGRRSYILNK